MIRHARNLVAMVFAVVLAAACNTPDPVQVLPQLTFSHLPPLALDVAEVEVLSSYVSPLKAPNVEHQLSTPPEKAVQRWAADRLKAVGSSGRARLTIANASVVETPLETSKGFSSHFTKEQSRRYDMSVDATLEIVSDDGRIEGFSSTRVNRSRTMREDATLNERDRIWFDMTEALMKDFDAQMEQSVRQYMVNWLR